MNSGRPLDGLLLGGLYARSTASEKTEMQKKNDLQLFEL